MNDINQKNEHNQQAQDVEPGRINSDTITGNYASSFEHKDYVENTQHDSIANENKWIPEKHDDGFFLPVIKTTARWKQSIRVIIE